MKGFIYIIRNNINEKVYIGQTRNSIAQRWAEHLRHAAYGKQLINRAMKKYGNENFYISVLEECPIEDLDTREIYYIEEYDATNKEKGYNVSLGGETPLFKKPFLDVEKIINLYVNQQYTLQKVSDYFGVSRYIITQELKKAGINIRDRHVSAERVSKINKESIVEALNNSSSLREAAAYAKISYSTFRKACLYYSIEYNFSTSARH